MQEGREKKKWKCLLLLAAALATTLLLARAARSTDPGQVRHVVCRPAPSLSAL